MRYVLFAFGLALAASVQLAAQAPKDQPAPDGALRAVLRDDALQGRARNVFLEVVRQQFQQMPQLGTAGPAKRIWATNKDVEEVWFRRSVELQKPCQFARLVFSCDNDCTVFVNGQQVGACDDHQNLTVVDLKAATKGKVTLAVRAKNTGGPGALVLWFLWEDADGKHELTTDEKWRISLTDVDEWSEQIFDDSRWDFATAEYETEFGKNTYNGMPIKVHLTNHLTPAIQPIEKAVEALRIANDREAALKALEELDRAVVRAREHVWKMPAAADKAPK